jgi:hypothetical protein
MKYTILFDRNENIKEMEAQEQARFIRVVLDEIGIPIQFDPNKVLSIDEKIKFQKTINMYNISIVDDGDGGIKVFIERELKAEFYKCKYKLKQDLHKIDPKKRLYMEMIVEFSSIKKGDTSK